MATVWEGNGSPPSHVIIPRTSHFLSEGTAGSVCWWGRILWNSVQKIRNEPPKWPCWAMLNSEGYPNVGGRDDFPSLLLPPGAKVKALLRENPLEDQPAPTVRHTQQRMDQMLGKLMEHMNNGGGQMMENYGNIVIYCNFTCETLKTSD